MRLIRVLFCGLVLSMVLSGSVSAQATPDLVPSETFNLVDPALCTPEPANLARIREISTDPLATPDGSLEDRPLLNGDRIAEPDAAQSVKALHRTMFACINANEPARFLSLFTDDFFHRNSADVAAIIEAAEEQAEADEQQPLDDGYAIVAASEVTVLADGRHVHTTALGWVRPEPQTEAPIADELIQIVAVQTGDTWMIDDLRVADYDDPNQQPDCGEGCADPAETVPVEGSGYTGWAMSAEVSAASAVRFLNNTDELIAGFAPTTDEIAEAEATLVSFLGQQDRGTDRMRESLDQYLRQYIGLETQDGRLLIINAFCDAVGADPASGVVTVEDGGDCFWYAVYNLSTGSFERLLVNGES